MACLLMPDNKPLLLVGEVTPLTFVWNCLLFLVLLLLTMDPLLVVLQGFFS